MAMFLIAGGFRITGAQPDGDSIRFTPDDPAKWDLITGPNRVKRNASGAAQLRLDAIDALETHYGTPRTHQPLGLAHAAAAELLDWLGFSNVVRAPDETVTSSIPDAVAGYIFTRSSDLYGRCIALVGRGAPPHDDGSSVFVDVAALRSSANHHLISQGLVYPTYYRGLFPDLRNELTAAAKQARDSGLGVWASDATTTGFDVTGLEVLQKRHRDRAQVVPPPRRLPASRGRLDGGLPRVPRSGRRQVLHPVHRALDHRTGRHRGSHRRQREDDPSSRRPRLRREMTIRPPSASSRWSIACSRPREALDLVPALAARGIRIRVGIHVDECEKRGVGARTGSLAGPVEILASRTVRDLSAGSGMLFEGLGAHRLKGVPEDIDIYRVSKP